MATIELFNQNTKPYGPLSNNSNFTMTIYKENWNNVTQFIYTNMVSNYMYRDQIKKSKPKNIYDTYIKYLKKSEEDVIAESLAEGMRVKFENPDVLKILLSTGDEDIIYISNNKFLGVGFNNDGENILGKYLVQYRNNILNTTVKQEKLFQEQNNLYEAYIIYNILKKEIVENGNDLSDYLYLKSGPKRIFDYHIVKTIRDIINIYFTKNPENKIRFENLVNDSANKNFFLELYERKDPEYHPLLQYSLKSSSVIVLELRKRYLGKMASQQNMIKQNKVFNMYLEYVLENNFPRIKKEDYTNIIEQQLKEELKTKIYEDELQSEKNKIKDEEKKIMREKEELKINNELKQEEIRMREEINKIRGDEDMEDEDKEEMIKIEKQKHLVFAPVLAQKIKKKENEIRKREEALKKQEHNLEIEYEVKLYEEYNKLEKRIFGVIEQMPAPLKDKIDIFLAAFKTPSQEDVDFAESFELKNVDSSFEIEDFTFPGQKPVEEKEKVIRIHPGNPSPNYVEDLNLIKRNSYQVLSPIYYTGMLRINGFDYPTITHYIVARLFASLPGIGSLKETQKYILKDPTGESWVRNTPTNWINYKELFERYYHVSMIVEDNKLKELCKIGLNKKFEDRTLQNLLLSTDKKQLIWNDRNDTVLGVAKDKKGENFVGHYLMELRTQIFNRQQQETLSVLTEENVSNIIENDLFMYHWVDMRVKDMCDVAKKVKRYMSAKYKLNLDLSGEFFALVLNRIYQPCSDFREMSKDVTADIPLYFVTMVNSYIKNKYTPSIIKLLWKRIVVMVYYLIKSVNNPTLYNIKNILLKIETLISKQDNCVKIVTKSKRSNCIISAIINVLSGISKFSKRVEKLVPIEGYAIVDKKRVEVKTTNIDPAIDKEDIELAISIILNKNVSFDLENKRLKQKEKEEDLEEEKKEEDRFGENEEETGKAVEMEMEGLEDIYQDETKQEAEEESEGEQDFYAEESEAEDEDNKGDKENEGEDFGEYDGADSENKPVRARKNTDNYYIAQIKKYLEANKIIKTHNIGTISRYIYNASSIIFNYKMSEKIKDNRINFFATIK